MAATGVEARTGVVTVLPEAEAAQLVRRSAGARGLDWPQGTGGVQGIGGLQADLAGDRGDERLVWGTLNNRDGVIGLFRGDRLLDSPNRGLGQVQRVQLVRLPGLPYYALMVDDLVDQRTGAYLTEQRRRIYVWDGRRLRQVFLGTLKREELFHAQWENPRAPVAWRRRQEEGEIRLQGPMLTEQVRRTEWEAVGSPQEPIPGDDRFRLRSEETEERRLQWNPRLRRFEPA